MKLIDKQEGIYLLDDENLNFPTQDMMKNDLVAIGGDFHPQRIVNAYKNGLFPWFIDEYNYIHWYSPQDRMVLFPNEFKLSKSLKRTIKNKGFIIKSNENFEEVIKRCSSIKRKEEEGRKDDNEDVLKSRLDVYFTQTQPLIDYYSKLKLLEKVDGTKEIIQVNQDINMIMEAI